MDDFERPPLYIDDDTDTSLSNIRSKARCHQMRHGLDLLVIDYLTLIAVTDRLAGENQTQRIRSHTSSTRKRVSCPRTHSLARRARIMETDLSQLSRACEQRADKRPIPSDLRESGSIEQDADKILMLYRESEYNEDCEDPNLTEVWIRKNRHGPKGCVALHFAPEKMSFADHNDSASM